MNLLRLAVHCSCARFSSGSSESARISGSTASSSPRLTGKTWQNGSPFSNLTGVAAAVNIQFMVNE